MMSMFLLYILLYDWKRLIGKQFSNTYPRMNQTFSLYISQFHHPGFIAWMAESSKLESSKILYSFIHYSKVC